MTNNPTTGSENGLEANDNQVNDNQSRASVPNYEAKSKTSIPGQVEARPGQDMPKREAQPRAPETPEIPNSTPHNPDTSTVSMQRQQQMTQGTPTPYAGNKHSGNKTKDGKSTRDVGDKNRNRTGSESNRERND